MTGVRPWYWGKTPEEHVLDVHREAVRLAQEYGDLLGAPICAPDCPSTPVFD